MISDSTARKMAVKFFKEQECPELAKESEEDCLDLIFAAAVESLGKSKVLALYNKLPKQLKVYMLLTLEGRNDESLKDSLGDLYDKLSSVVDSARPERTKRFAEYIEKTEKALLRYLTRR